jgi:hypothetical protein
MKLLLNGQITKDIESLRDKRKKGNHRKATEEYIEKLTEIIVTVSWLF